jgi:hypothetical protein
MEPDRIDTLPVAARLADDPAFGATTLPAIDSEATTPAADTARSRWRSRPWACGTSRGYRSHICDCPSTWANCSSCPAGCPTCAHRQRPGSSRPVGGKSFWPPAFQPETALVGWHLGMRLLAGLPRALARAARRFSATGSTYVPRHM